MGLGEKRYDKESIDRCARSGSTYNSIKNRINKEDVSHVPITMLEITAKRVQSVEIWQGRSSQPLEAMPKVDPPKQG